MPIIGNTDKMSAVVDASGVVQYEMKLGDNKIHVNPLIGKSITLRHTSKKNCVECNSLMLKSHRNTGFCQKCFYSLAKADACRVSPEKCHYSNGTCREPSWGEKNCFNSHIVYVSNTGQRKVGITRHSSDSVSSRWLDQGATSAVPFIATKNRLLSGIVESILKKHVGDRTNWRKMLAETPKDDGLLELVEELKSLVDNEIQELQVKYGLTSVQWIINPVVQHIEYPVNKYPEKPKSVNLDKELKVTGVLAGIKGQYLLFDDGAVVNIRKYAGYELELTINE